MTDVHTAFKTLSPTEHSEFPSDSASLSLHLATSLADAHFLISSLPPPASIPESVTLPELSNPDTAVLQKEWKPVKLSAKENPIGVSVFKLSAKDGKGTWFARRSIHTDIPFRRFKAGLQQEFQQPREDGSEEGVVQGPVRGIGKNLRIHHEVCELGKAEIFQLSAQFPGPSAPRDFVEGCLSSSAHPEDAAIAANERGRHSSTTNPEDDTESSAKDRPKQFTLISRPVLNHPQGDERSGYVRGAYESVEFIREIPSIHDVLARSQSTPDVPSIGSSSASRPRGETVGMASEEAAQARENFATDWIMITRSDPGGSVPKWMVERGTPAGIVKDADKFLKWCRHATFLDGFPEAPLDAITQMEHGEKLGKSEDVKAHTKRYLIEGGAPAGAVLSSDHAQAEMSVSKQSEKQSGNTTNSGGGLFAGALATVAAGMSSLAHSAIYSGSSNNTTPPPTSSSDKAPTVSWSSPPDLDLDGNASETDSIKTFATADSSQPEVPESSSRPASVTSTMTAASTTHEYQSPEERALAQFLKEKQKLEEKLKREDHRRSEREKKIAEKHAKNLEKQERKYRHALEKANEKRQKEEEKRRREVQKMLERGEKGRRREIDELKKVVGGLTRENLALRQRIEELENTKPKGEEVATAEKVES